MTPVATQSTRLVGAYSAWTSSAKYHAVPEGSCRSLCGIYVVPLVGAREFTVRYRTCAKCAHSAAALQPPEVIDMTDLQECADWCGLHVDHEGKCAER